MILALDSYYKEDICNTSLVLFANVESQIPIYTDTIFTKVKSKYIPGEFYKRELPGIKKILFKLKLDHPEYWSSINMIIVDSFITLKTEDKEWDGLGKHLYNTLAEDEKKIIVGVAKSNFGECDKISELVYRGTSKTPLYVQSTNDNKVAAMTIQMMYGKYRIPNMLKEVDKLSRNFDQSNSPIKYFNNYK